MLKEFKDFAAKGNFFDMAIGIIMGLAVGKVVTSFVTDILMPPIGLLLGKTDFSSMFIDISGKGYSTLAEAKAAGAPIITYGSFINTIIDFLIVAFVIFMLARQVNRFKATPIPPKDCPFCFSKVPAPATRCPNCTSELPSQ